MSLDEAHHRLFTATWKPSQLVVFDTETGKEVAESETAGPSDDLYYDAARGRIYVLTGSGPGAPGGGFLEVFQDRDHTIMTGLRTTQTDPIAGRRARNGAIGLFC